jgi:hypothetical protein
MVAPARSEESKPHVGGVIRPGAGFPTGMQSLCPAGFLEFEAIFRIQRFGYPMPRNVSWISLRIAGSSMVAGTV